jgi:hypothetical protein
MSRSLVLEYKEGACGILILQVLIEYPFVYSSFQYFLANSFLSRVFSIAVPFT